MAEGFRIATGFVEVETRLDKAQIKAAADEAAAEFDAASKGKYDKIGKKAGDELGGGISDRLAKALKDAGSKDGTVWRDEFTRAAKRGDVDTLDVLAKGLEPAFKRAGKDGAATLYRELARALGSGGLDTGYAGNDFIAGVGRQVVDAFAQFGQKGGLAAGDAFKGGFMSGLGDFALAVSPALAPAAVALAAELLAAVGGAVEGVGGLGGIITGSLIQLKTNPAVQGAAKDFGGWLGTEFKDETAVFAGPLQDAFKILKTDLKGPVADLGKDFAYLAPYVRDFATYIGAAVEKFMPGFNRMIQSSGPVLTELGHGLVYVADGANVLFDEISKGGKGEVEALDTIFRVLGYTLAGVGYTIRGASEIFDGLVQVEKTAVDWTDKWLGKWTLFGPLIHATGLKDEVDGVSRSFDGSGASISGFSRHLDTVTSDVDRQKTAIDSLVTSWDKWLKGVLNVDEANIAAHRSISALTDSIKQNGRQWDLTTKAGQNNQEAVVQAIRDQQNLRDANIASGMSAAQANAIYQTNADKILNMAHQAGFAGTEYNYLKSQVDGLSYSLTNLVKKVDAAHLAQVAASGFGLKQGLLKGGIHGVRHAATGLVDAGVYSNGPILFAEPETEGEAFVPRHTSDPDRAMRVLQEAAGWYGQMLTPANRGADLGRLAAQWSSPAAQPMRAPGAVTQPPGAMPGRVQQPIVIEFGGQVVAALVVEAITDHPVVVSKAATEGARLRRIQNSGRVS